MKSSKNKNATGSFCKRDVLNPMLPVASEACGQRGATAPRNIARSLAANSGDQLNVQPKRIQRKRSAGWKMPANTVYVGRPTKWGNPFLIGSHHSFYDAGGISIHITSVDISLDLYKQRLENLYVNDAKYFDEFIKPLKGKNLACWCALGSPCHADILLEMANKLHV